MKISDIFNNSMGVTLDEINYRKLPPSPDPQIQIEIKDETSFKGQKGKEVFFSLKRTVKVNPECLFEVIIAGTVRRILHDEQIIEAKKIDLSKFIDELDNVEKSAFFGNLLPIFSTIAAQCTFWGNNNPIVVPPNL